MQGGFKADLPNELNLAGLCIGSARNPGHEIPFGTQLVKLAQDLSLALPQSYPLMWVIFQVLGLVAKHDEDLQIRRCCLGGLVLPTMSLFDSREGNV